MSAVGARGIAERDAASRAGVEAKCPNAAGKSNP